MLLSLNIIQSVSRDLGLKFPEFPNIMSNRRLTECCTFGQHQIGKCVVEYFTQLKATIDVITNLVSASFPD